GRASSASMSRVRSASRSADAAAFFHSALVRFDERRSNANTTINATAITARIAMIQPHGVELPLDVEAGWPTVIVVVGAGSVEVAGSAVVGASLVLGASVVVASVVGASVVVSPGNVVTCAGRRACIAEAAAAAAATTPIASTPTIRRTVIRVRRIRQIMT